MSNRIIRLGCPGCGAEFLVDEDDVDGPTVACPICISDVGVGDEDPLDDVTAESPDQY